MPDYTGWPIKEKLFPIVRWPKIYKTPKFYQSCSYYISEDVFVYGLNFVVSIKSQAQPKLALETKLIKIMLSFNWAKNKFI